ncbi:hypothetical protein LCGC14_1649000 [marine sediment metagenome]|uniref:Uncharacterized protein n=1 Tax=marine sediment metagenome TaxID=412755 RepID=A0A0F9KXK5_9ZZZZ
MIKITLTIILLLVLISPIIADEEDYTDGVTIEEPAKAPIDPFETFNGNQPWVAIESKMPDGHPAWMDKIELPPTLPGKQEKE